MADVDGYEVTCLYFSQTVEPRRDASASMPVNARVDGTLSTPTYYLMEANDSVTDAPYGWVATGSADWAGTGYTGPNSPVGIRISGKR